MNNCYNDREILLISLVIQHNLGCGEKDVRKNTNCWCIKNCLEMLCNHAALHYPCQVDQGVLAAFAWLSLMIISGCILKYKIRNAMTFAKDHCILWSCFFRGVEIIAHSYVRFYKLSLG